MTSKSKLSLFLYIYLLIPSLIGLRIIPYEYRYESMSILIIISILYAWKRKFTWKELGFRRNNFLPALKWQLGFALFVLISIYLLMHSGLVRRLDPPENPWFYVMYLFISGPVQEFVYRSVVFAELNQHKYLSPMMKISLAAFTFSWLHIIYLEPITYFSSLMIGFCWSWMYYYRMNYWAISIGHALIGFSAIWFGLI